MAGVKVLHIGIAPPAYVKERMLAIARGEKRQRGEPKVWVSSLESLAKILSERNMFLLEIIRNAEPQSLTELAKLSNRHVSNLSRTLHGMKQLGLVALEQGPNGRKTPTVLHSEVEVKLSLSADGDAAQAA